MCTYSQVRAASGQDDFVSFQVPSLGGQRTVHQGTAFQKAVEHRNQRPLVIVPSQTKLLAHGHCGTACVWYVNDGVVVVVRGAFGFLRYLTNPAVMPEIEATFFFLDAVSAEIKTCDATRNIDNMDAYR